MGAPAGVASLRRSLSGAKAAALRRRSQSLRLTLSLAGLFGLLFGLLLVT
jgi:hypothetical protein